MSLKQKQHKTKRARFRHKKLKHEEYRTSSESEDKSRPPQVFSRRGDGYLTEHLFEADEQELRDSLKLLVLQSFGIAKEERALRAGLAMGPFPSLSLLSTLFILWQFLNSRKNMILYNSKRDLYKHTLSNTAIKIKKESVRFW